MTAITGKRFEQETLPYLDDLWQTALWLTTNEGDAERLVENCFLEASRLWDETACQENCRFWMFGVLMRVFLKDNKPLFLPQTSRLASVDYDPFPADKISLINEIPGEVITEVIRSLPTGNRLIIVLSIFEKFSYRQIAELVGMPVKNVCRKIYQAYSIIHKELIGYFAADKMHTSIANYN
jgi:RNA polymerase sigma-70 factor (ECF subfamily)